MKKNWRVKRIALLAVPVLLGVAVMLQTSSLAQQASPSGVAVAQGPDATLVFDYADRITRLVQTGKIDELSHLNIPTTSSQTNKLRDWTSEYITEVQEQEKQRDKQYSEAVAKAQDQLKQEHYEQAMEGVVLAYRIAKDPAAFLELPWVKELTAKVATRAADLEKQGRWIESLQRYSDLNTLYEIDTRYKADMQRLARRTRLLAVYTPKTLYEMRKKVLDQERAAAAATNPAAAPADDDQAPDPASFTRWQDYVRNITIEMMRKSIEHSADDWVEKTTYDTLVKGGIDALRLFLTTPELAKEFTSLDNAAERRKFNDALDGALALGAGRELKADDVENMVSLLIKASNDSVKLPKEVIIMEFTDGAMEKLDPFSAVIWPHEVPEFEKNMQGKFGGIGIQISLEKDPTNVDKIAIKNEIKKLEGPSAVEIPPALEKDKEAKVGSSYKLVVISPLENTPAFRAGIKAGDIITAIDGKSTDGISMDQAVSSIMGAPGSPVTLKVKRGQSVEKEFLLKRDIIKVASIKGFKRDASDPTGSRWDYMLDPESKVGYIRITGFQEDTAEDLQNAISNLKDKGMRGLVVDLRFNPGGLLQAAVDMCDMFLQDGVIVSTRGRSRGARSQDWKAHASTEIPASMPMVVLINEYSASASEIFSGAMKDLHRALIVGHRSFGKGSVQNLLNIGKELRADTMPEAMMKLTMAYYYLPNGESLHRRDNMKTWGVDPNVSVDLTPDQLNGLLKSRRDSDIIHSADDTPPATVPAAVPTTKPAPVVDTQLETALLMMRLQLIQSPK